MIKDNTSPESKDEPIKDESGHYWLFDILDQFMAAQNRAQGVEVEDEGESDEPVKRV